MKKPKGKPFIKKPKVQRRTDDKFYHTTTWRKFRQMFLFEHPLCTHCHTKGKITPATEVDHITPIAEGGDRLDEGNCQALCHSCHSRKTMKELNRKRYENN